MHTLTANTQIIIAPGCELVLVKAIITIFHGPKSTLLLLVLYPLMGENWHKIYRHALDNDFRFLSYGDSSLLIP
ncbi:MAG: S-adenosylmethionine:tRNA ribosyltransferase-isomerase [Bacteroidaceae bacterium]